MLQLFLDAGAVKGTFALATFAADPLEAIVRQELGHLFHLLLVSISLNSQLSDLLDAILTSCHRQLLILIFQVRDFAILLCQLLLQSGIHCFKLAQSTSH